MRRGGARGEADESGTPPEAGGKQTGKVASRLKAKKNRRGGENECWGAGRGRLPACPTGQHMGPSQARAAWQGRYAIAGGLHAGLG